MKKNKLILLAIIVIAVLVAVIVILAGNPYSKYAKDKYIQVADYKTMSITHVEPKVKQDEIDARIDQIVSKETKTDTKTIENGDTVFLDYIATINGNIIENGSVTNTKFVVGDDSLPGKVNEKLIGKRAGDEFTTKVFYSENEGTKETAGNTVEYQVYIDSVQTEDGYTKKFVQKKGFKSKKEYEEYIEEQILAEKKRKSAKSEKADLWDDVMKNSIVKKYPKKLLKKEAHNKKDLDMAIAYLLGYDWEQYEKQYLLMSDEEYTKNAVESAKIKVKERLVAHKIAKDNKIKVTKETYKKWLAKGKRIEETDDFEQRYGMSFSDYESKAELKEECLIEVVKSYLYKQAVKNAK